MTADQQPIPAALREANRLIDEMLAAQTRFATAHYDSRDLTEQQQQRDETVRDRSRSALMILMRDAVRYRWMRGSHLSGAKFVGRIGVPDPPHGTIWRGVQSTDEYDQAVDEQMTGQNPLTVKMS